MLLNPNNHALDGGPATAEMEKEAVAQIAAMFGYQQHLGHLTASGTIANLEALWVARELHPDAAIVSGANAHYTHARVSAVLGARHETVPADAIGRIDLDALAARLARGGVGTVVATPGTTALGAIDDVAAIADLCAEHGARLHVDAAYGGFFRLLADDGDPGVARAPFEAIARADSIVVDPHKHGLQPYGCGCVVFADPGVGRLYAHDSPYTYFTSDALHLGEISHECSRAGAAAAALWTTLRALPLTRAGLGRHLSAARAAGLELASLLSADERTELVLEPELDIVCVRSATDPSAAERAFDTLADAGWHVAKLRLDSGEVVLRCCLLKQEHAGIAPELAAALAEHLTPDR
jgi:glutamate/tyrosine decarboxylase-like PLP-dependent enzyme